MKKLIVLVLILIQPTVFAQAPTLDNITESDLKKVSTEFAANFTHTVVSAPNTNGIFGFEVGVMGGLTGTPELSDLIEAAGEDGSDFKRLPHGGLIARGHFPFDLFVEASFLPEIEAADVTVNNFSAGVGWNFGTFFNWPLDIAIGVDGSWSKVSYSQIIDPGGANVEGDVNFKSSTRTLWAGVSKKILMFTPYAKVGSTTMDADINVDASSGTIFAFTSSQKASTDNTGTFLAAGLNVDLLFLKLGFEGSRIMGVNRATGKLSFSF